MTRNTDRNGMPIDMLEILAAHRRWRETDGQEGARARLDWLEREIAGGFTIEVKR